ncbi:hypothetical protein V1478_018517 [Vespula squamosa]|uniref:Uncharacterized protein n=1 Tax=Vespula squamosa TaxID=30214 RepID=A0ABD1ZSZ8_VESSQ
MDCLLVELFEVGRISIGRGSRDSADIVEVGVAEVCPGGEERDTERNEEKRTEWRASLRTEIEREEGKRASERVGGSSREGKKREREKMELGGRVMLGRLEQIMVVHINNNDISLEYILQFQYSISQVILSNESKHICRDVSNEFLAILLSSLMCGFALKLDEAKVRFI